MFTATRWQLAAYLGGVCLFSIAFLVYVNATASFLVSDIIGESKGIGDAVGSLGFADECVSIVACPLWGLVSDRVGVRNLSTYCSNDSVLSLIDYRSSSWHMLLLGYR